MSNIYIWYKEPTWVKFSDQNKQVKTWLRVEIDLSGIATAKWSSNSTVLVHFIWYKTRCAICRPGPYRFQKRKRAKKTLIFGINLFTNDNTGNADKDNAFFTNNNNKLP